MAAIMKKAILEHTKKLIILSERLSYSYKLGDTSANWADSTHILMICSELREMMDLAQKQTKAARWKQLSMNFKDGKEEKSK